MNKEEENSRATNQWLREGEVFRLGRNKEIYQETKKTIQDSVVDAPDPKPRRSRPPCKQASVSPISWDQLKHGF